MRIAASLLVVLVLVSFADAQLKKVEKLLGPGQRYLIGYDPKEYPQSTPKETLRSIDRAINQGNFEYFLAHLADPKYIDAQVARNLYRFRGTEDNRKLLAFEYVVRQIRKHFRNDPSLLKELQLLALANRTDKASEKARWTPEANGLESVSAPSVRGVKAFFRTKDARWFLLNRQR